jgi:uncharacterized protein YdeI (YjbR/CyaY-like superfamily)
VDILTCHNAADWEDWLAGHYALPDGVWLKIAKRHSGQVTVTAAEALDVALCYGWIDSQRKPHDDAYFVQRYSRRRTRSPWSAVNAGRVATLIAAGRMREPGFAAIAAAQADGRWPTQPRPDSSLAKA